MTLLHNMIEASQDSEYWTNTAIIQAIIGIWFAASHQPWLVSIVFYSLHIDELMCKEFAFCVFRTLCSTRIHRTLARRNQTTGTS